VEQAIFPGEKNPKLETSLYFLFVPRGTYNPPLIIKQQDKKKEALSGASFAFSQ